MEEAYAYTAAVVTLITMYLLYRRSCKAKLPPGPTTLPIIGNLHQMGEDVHLIFQEMAKKCGGMFSLRLGSLQFIVVSDLDIAREVLVSRGHLFADRYAERSGNLITRNQRDVILGKYTEAWKVHRKISHRALHMFGEGMQMLEGKMLHEVERLSRYLSMNESKVIDISEEIDWAIFSFMCQVVFGHTYKRDDPELKELQESFGTIMDLKYTTSFIDFLPSLSVITKLFKPLSQKKLEEAVKVRDQIFDEKFKKAKIGFRMGCTTNYAEALIQAALELEDDKKGIKQYISDDRLIMSMFDIFIGGSETTSSTIKWAILYMIVWPEVQEKVYQEITEALDKGRDGSLIHLSSRKSLPYTEAALMETLRLSSVSYLGLWHQTTEDVNLRGYNIPKGVNFIINYYAIHHNEKNFKDPFGFHPERFLDEEGQLVKGRYQSYLPFSAGPRYCLGEPLAKALLFVIVANLIKRFRFSAAPTMPHPDLNGRAGVNLRPKPFMVSIESRD